MSSKTKEESNIKSNANNVFYIPILSFFTGGGFLDMGFEKAGFNIVWTNENNVVFTNLYAEGYSSWRKSMGKTDVTISEKASVESLKASEILTKAFEGNKPDIFGIIGGPPCPDFSTGGKHNGSEGDRGRLTKTFVDLLCKIQPAFFMMENVAGLHRVKKHREFLYRMEDELRNSGYYIEHSILNAINFGVPQNRERIFVAGIKKSLAKKYPGYCNDTIWFPWPKVKKYDGALTKYKWPKVSGIDEPPSMPKSIPEVLFVNSILVSKDNRDKVPNANNIFRAYSEKFETIPEGDTSGWSFKRLHRYRYSPTTCYGHNEVHLHPWEHRRLSLREAMRLQGIPDTYRLPEDGALSKKFKLVSNGVPVPLAKYVAKSMKKVIMMIIQNGDNL
ncbi:MAG: DNA cytosine methyltransferase [Smithella sp.]